MRARLLLLSALVLCLTLPLEVRAQQDDGDRLSYMDVFELEYASDPQISPDGRQVVYVRSGFDVMTDRTQTGLWILGVDGAGHRPLVAGEGNPSSPRWSPDGRRLLYAASDDHGKRQLYVRWMDTGQTARLTQVEHGPGGIAWSPDGSQVAFTMFVAEDSKPLATMPQKPKGAEWAPPARVVDDTIYRADGGGYLTDGHRQVFVVPAEGGTPRQLTEGPYDHGAPVWAPDSRALILSANRREDANLVDPLNSEIYEVTLADGAIRPLTDRMGPDGDPAVSPDGRYIAYTGFDDRQQGYQVSALYVMNRDGSGSRVVTTGLDRDPDRPIWSADGRGLFFQYDDEGNTKVAYVERGGGDVRVLAEDLGGTSLGRPYGGGSFSVANGGRFAYTKTRPDHPSDVAVGGPGLEAGTLLTRLNDDLLGHKTLAEVEEIWYPSSFDGRRIQGWIAKPPGFDPAKKYPLLLEIHGGPFANYGDRFAAEVQLFAAQGYVVLYTNPRGSTSYGAEFGNLIHHNYPSQDYDDLISGVDAVIERGYIDADNLFVTGGSGGGVLTSWIVGKTDRFSAAVVAKPVINWVSWALTADMYPMGVRYWFPGPPWEHMEHYMARSPISLVGNVTTPTMLLTGEADYRTPISESEQYYQALRLRGVPTVMVRIPEASHGITARPSNLIAKVAYIVAWFDKYRTDGGGEQAGTHD